MATFTNEQISEALCDLLYMLLDSGSISYSQLERIWAVLEREND